jgi:hypothetical protein
MTKKIILYCGLSEKKTCIPKDTINTLNKEIIKPKCEIQSKSSIFVWIAEKKAFKIRNPEQ